MKPVLVTGGAGFVGKQLVEKLLARGESVRVLDLSSDAVPGTEHIQGDITQSGVVREAMAGVACVFHLAGNAQLWARNPADFDCANRVGTEIVIAACEARGVERLVHCSSLTTLIGRRSPRRPFDADETIRWEPEDMLGAYPRSKLRAEREVEDAVARGLDAVIALPTEPLGPGDTAITPPTRMLIDFLNGANPAYVGAILNFVPVDALADGLIACADKGKTGERYLFGGENIEMGRLLAKLELLTGRKMPSLQLPFFVALMAGAVDTFIANRITKYPPKAPLTGVRLASRPARFSSAKAKRDLGWEAPPMDEALKASVDWMQTEGLVGAG